MKNARKWINSRIWVGCTRMFCFGMKKIVQMDPYICSNRPYIYAHILRNTFQLKVYYLAERSYTDACIHYCVLG